jgi:hypothetical protein
MAASFIQINKKDFTSSSASLAVSFSSGTTAGSIILVVGAFDLNTTSVTLSGGGTVTDSGKGIVTTTAGTGCKSFIKAFFSPTAGTTTITATYSGTNPTFGDLYIYEIGGLTNATFDKVVQASGNSATPSSGSTGTLSSATEAAIAYGCTGANFTTAGSGWSTGQGSTVGTNGGDGLSTIGSIGEHQVISATTAISGTATGSGSISFDMWCATVMSSAAAGSQPPFTQVLIPWYSDWA